MTGTLWMGLLAALALLAGAAAQWLRLRRSHRRLEAQIAELRQQARIQQSILDSMGDGVLVVDEQGELQLVNPAAERIIGIGIVPGGPGERIRHHGLYLPDQTTPYPAAELPLARAIRGESCDDLEVFVATRS